MSKKINYKQYIQSSAWYKKRAEVKARFNWTCQRCKRKSWTLQVHHLTYKNLGNEQPEDLTLLCKRCHEKIHKCKFNYE